MVQIITEPDRIRTWVKAKQTNEQELLRRLNRAYGNPVAYRAVRRVVMSALLQMKIEAIERPEAVKAALQESFREDLAVWQKVISFEPAFPLNQLGKMLADLCTKPDRFDIGDLSELIRVIGGWLEKGGGYGGIPDELNKAFRPGIKSGGHGTATAAWEVAQKLIWDKKTVRQREDRIMDPELYHLIEQHVRSAWVRPKFNRPSGLQMFRVNANDLCKKIDLFFGLLKGATISGTTTDTVLVLEAFGAEKIGPKTWVTLHPGYYLFPVATIAASLHHTLLEAGLALSLVDAIDCYCVGFYSSLKPAGGFPDELKGVEGLLNGAEKDIRNKHFVIWYDGSETRPAGCILWDKPAEIEEARRTLYNGKELLTVVRNLPPIPRKKDAGALVARLAPNLYGRLPMDIKKSIYGN